MHSAKKMQIEAAMAAVALSGQSKAPSVFVLRDRDYPVVYRPLKLPPDEPWRRKGKKKARRAT